MNHFIQLHFYSVAQSYDTVYTLEIIVRFHSSPSKKFAEKLPVVKNLPKSFFSF